MQAEKGEKLFEDWQRNPQPMGFSARLLIRWISRRCGVSKREATAAVMASPAPESLDALISSTFLLMNAEPHGTPASSRDAAWGRALRVAAMRQGLANARQGNGDGPHSEWPCGAGALLQNAGRAGGAHRRLDRD